MLAGRPAPGRELTEDYNPLEAGLYHAVSVNKVRQPASSARDGWRGQREPGQAQVAQPAWGRGARQLRGSGRAGTFA